jgi:class 3 adenylate cyclase
MDDMRAVLDAVGSTSTVLLGSHDGCSMAALFAATYPERTRALALFHPVAHDPVLESALETGAALDELAALRDGWGTQEFADELLAEGAPSLYADPKAREWFANWLRLGASPAVAYALNRAWFEIDLRHVLPSVRVPTLVLYRQDAPLDLTRRAEDHARDVAKQIRGARLMRVSGRDRFAIFLSLDIPEEVERFVAGEAIPEVPESVLATLLFTDIVGSTERAATLGDRAWRELLERHHALVRRELSRYRGEEKDTAGDGFFATFDGPARAIRCADAIVDGVRALGLEVRAGVHTGECELHEGKVAGLAVVIGARVAAAAEGGEVLVSQTVKDLVAGAGLEFEERGERELKGVPGSWRVYSVADVAAHARS